jgi:hypothetical protein
MTYIKRLIKRLDLRLILIIISLLAVSWLQFPRLTDEFRVDEDFRYQYWMNKFQDPAVYPNISWQNLLLSIRMPWGDVSLSFQGLGYSLLFYAASFVVPPVLFSKILPLFLMPITVWFLFEFGWFVRDRATGVVLATGFLFINLASSSAISIANGLQRSFATTLMIALIFYLYHRKYTMAAVFILASAVIYAPVFALAGATWGLSALAKNWRPYFGLTLTQGGIVQLIISVCLGALLLSPVLFPGLINVSEEENSLEIEQQEQDPELSGEEYRYLWDNPIYRPGGAYPLFIVFPIVGRGGLVDLGEDLINLLILLLLGGLIYLARGRRALDLPFEIWCLLWASIIMFVMAWLTVWLTGSFLLYLPSRYTRVGLFLFLLMFVGFNIVDAIKEAPALFQNNPRRLIWLVGGIELLVGGLIFLYPSKWTTISGLNMKWLLALAGLAFGLLGVAIIREPPRSTPSAARVSRTYGGRLFIGVVAAFCLSGWAAYAPLLTEVSYLNPPQPERELLRFLETLPKDALIAGTPCALNSVTLFAKREILFSCEQPSHGVIL